MNPELKKSNLKFNPKKFITVSLVTFILLMLAVTLQITYTVLNNDRIYNNVYINNTEVSNLSREEFTELLNKNYESKVAMSKLVLKSRDITQEIDYKDINVAYDITGAFEKAHNVGRTGNIFNRFSEIVKVARNGVRIDMPIIFSKEKVEEIVDGIYDKTLIKVKEADLLIQDSKVTIRSGHHGESIDKNKAILDIEASIREGKGEPVDIAIINTVPSKINVEEYAKKINKEPVDAAAKVEENKVTVVPEEMGRSIEMSSLVSIAAELENSENTEKVLPVIFTKPKIASSDVYARLFKDIFYTMSTKFNTASTNDANRGENIKIAVSKINGKILAPGQTFSFNDVVGPRTEAAGYKLAHAYSGGKIIDDVGGGICQVSTTLYNAVLFSDLEVVSRSNHMFTVGYVPYGRDAAVSYGSLDFKFKNSTAWPMKIEGTVSKDNKIYFTIKGTKENTDNTKIEISPVTVKTTNFNIKYIDDPTLEEGKTKIKQNGMKGYVVDTYKIVKKDGEVISKTKLHTSVYKPLDQQVLKGTKKPSAPTVPNPDASNTTETDDTGNTPVEPVIDSVPAEPSV